MPPTPYRRFRRLFRQAAGPAAYVLLMVLSFTIFVSAMHSCSEPTDTPAPTGVKILTGER